MFMRQHESTLLGPARGARVLLVFIFTLSSGIMPSVGQAQMVTSSVAGLPVPGAMLGMTEAYVPAMIRGITIHPDNALKFDFIVDTGHSGIAINSEAFRDESQRMIKYFFASLTVPETATWVNLSPYEENRIISEELGRTEMGRDMLAQDYLLKQLTASLMYPEDELGQEFWQRIYKQSQERYGTTDIPVDTFSKVWIVPDKAVVYEKDNSAYVLEGHLKVMLEQDFMALQENLVGANGRSPVLSEFKVLSAVTADVVREILIPEIEKEVNTGHHFAPLRQITNAMILAAWYKKSLKESLLGKIYVDKAKTQGVHVDDVTVHDKIYAQYKEAFKKGVYNYIREDLDTQTQTLLPKKYFSGGEITILDGKTLEERVKVVDGNIADSPMKDQDVADTQVGDVAKVNIDLDEDGAQPKIAGSALADFKTPEYLEAANNTIFGKRGAGILMHISSLPSRTGYGNFGQEAYDFVDFLKSSGITHWQMLPTGPTNPGDNSPYNTLSVNAGNPLFISPEFMKTDGWLDPEYDLSSIYTNDEMEVRKGTEAYLAAALPYFLEKSSSQDKRAYQEFINHNEEKWLRDYTGFTVMKKKFEGKSWLAWDDKYKRRNKESLDAFEDSNPGLIARVSFEQFVFDKQAKALKNYANSQGVKIFTDMPINPAMDSVDVWAHPRLFNLDENLVPTLVAGVPADGFSDDGQLWGNPTYNWSVHVEEDFVWWQDRLSRQLELADEMRIDHFRGFVKSWLIPHGSDNALAGHWSEALPIDALFKSLQAVMPEGQKLPVIAEDLGTITPDVEEARIRYQLPGMSVLVFAFDGNRNNWYLPTNAEVNNVSYTGTHDNPTIQEWYSAIEGWQKDLVAEYLEREVNPEEVHWDMLEMGMKGNPVLFVFPAQELLGLGKEGKMNVPGQAEGNWRWQFPNNWKELVDSKRLRTLTVATGRAEPVDEIKEGLIVEQQRQELAYYKVVNNIEISGDLLIRMAQINAGDRYRVEVQKEDGAVHFRLLDVETRSSLLITPEKGLRVKSFVDSTGHEVLNGEGLYFGFPVGRIKDGQFSWQGHQYDMNGLKGVTKNEDNVIHLGQNMAWTVDSFDVGPEGLKMIASVESEDEAQIIGKSKHSIVIQIKGDAMTIDRTTENLDNIPIPDVYGVHDWISVNNQSTLQGNMDKVFTVNKSLEPQELIIVETGSDFDVEAPKLVNELDFDTTFTNLPVDEDGFWTVVVDQVGDGRQVEVLAEAKAFPAVTVWTQWGGNISVEPVTAEQFALNRQDQPDTLLREIAPGESAQGRVIIRSKQSSSSASQKASVVQKNDPLHGGIYLDSRVMNMQIHRDGNGVPLPVGQQSIDIMNINGLYSTIMSVTPTSLQMLLGLKQDAANDPVYEIFADPMDHRYERVAPVL